MKQFYDVIGDVHGCYGALRRLCDKLGYDNEFNHPQNRKLVFTGDLINRGLETIEVLRLVCGLVRQHKASMVLGNHDDAMRRYLHNELVNIDDGRMRNTISEIESQPDAPLFIDEILNLYDNAPIVLILDNGALIVVHAGIEQHILDSIIDPDDPTRIIDDIDPEMRRFILNGDAIGKSPEGKTLRRDWAAQYHGDAFIVYGHTPHRNPTIVNNTINIDTGVYRGGFLTAFRWPEREIVSVPSLFSIVPESAS